MKLPINRDQNIRRTRVGTFAELDRDANQAASLARFGKPSDYEPSDYEPSDYEPSDYEPSDYEPSDYEPSNLSRRVSSAVLATRSFKISG